MDVQHYFDPVDFAAYYSSGHLNWKNSLGAVIEKNSQSPLKSNIGKLNVAIIGIPFDSRKADPYSPESTDKIRSELYQLSKFSSKTRIADFGNLKPSGSVNGNYQALRDIVDYFNELRVTTVIIGGSQDLSVGVCSAFKSDRYFSISTIDAFFDIKKEKELFNANNFLSRIFDNQPGIFQFNLIGFQSLYLVSESLNKIKSVSNNISLGNLRDKISLAEPVLRNSDFLSFDINSVKYSDAPGSLRVIPNGLRSEEACQLAKYAGLSNRLKVFGLFNVLPENDQNGLTVKLAAQVLWYFIDGFNNRDNKRPDLNENNLIYQVEVDGIDNPVVFYRNRISNQWWMEFETDEKKKLYFACSETDYVLASNNEIPQLWLNYIQKIDEVLK